MIENNVNLDLMAFIEQNILPKYNEFDLSHGLGHVQHVIKGSLELAKRMGADVNMAYTVASACLDREPFIISLEEKFLPLMRV